MPFTSAYRPTPFVFPPHAPCASRLACAGARIGAAMIAATASDAAIPLEAMILAKPERIDVSPLVVWAERPLARESARPEAPLYRCDERRWAKSTAAPASAAGDGSDDEKGLGPGRHRVGQRRVQGLVGQIPLAGEEPQERPALLGDVVPDRPAQHGIARLERVEHRRPCDRAGNFEQHVVFDVRQRPQMRRECDPDHFRVWTSTDSTAGRSRTMGVQLSPLSGDMYTCPPVVPKYTPHLSSESMAIASRSTLT